MAAHVSLPWLKRNVRASMVMRQWLTFLNKEKSCRDVTQAHLVAIHHHVLKSTTSVSCHIAGCVMREKRLGAPVCLSHLVRLVQLYETDWGNQISCSSWSYCP
jgi:hypothetical protein